ncbi:MAG TPA: glycoside hydrolase family 2 TIM barrel-domain containing protein [Armatimonadota bacterium]|jgi:hypothetical protein
MIRKADALEYQLSLNAPEQVQFEEGGETLLTPARWTPTLAYSEPVQLAGEWQVAYWPFPAAPEAILAGSCGSLTWEPIQQPGKVFYYDPEENPATVEGWNRVTMEHIDEDDGALLKREVEVPAAWCGKRILLRFEGLFPAGVIYWDGQPVGEQWSGLTPIEVDVTALAKPGARHTVAVRLYRRHSSVQLDMPRHAVEFVGLSRQAFLHAVEPVHIADLRLVPQVDEDLTGGALTGEVTLHNPTADEREVALRVSLLDAGGAVVATEQYEVTLVPGPGQCLPIHLSVEGLQLWNAERPHLYTVSVQLTCKGQVEQVVQQRVGFRRFEIINERALLNGQPVKFRGVNHLTFHPEFGLYTPEPWLRQCLTMMKRANVNAIRTHFFGPPELTDLCDELGIYFLQELPVDWGHSYVADPVHLGPILHRMEACVRRDRNHPSVMVWSLGNENMPQKEETHDIFMEHLRLAQKMVKTVDPTRMTMFPPPGPAGKIKGIFETRYGDLADIHYSFKMIRQFNETGVLTGNPRTWEPTFEEDKTRAQLLAEGWNGVWFSSEYGIINFQADMMNSPYLSIIADILEDPLSGKNTQQVFIDRLTREWGYMRDDPTCLGGAYFPWMASGAGDVWGWTRWGEDADWGVMTGDLTPKPAFWALRVIFSPVRLPERLTWKPGDTEVTFTVYNDYNSVNLSECTFRTQMGGGPPYMGMMREWKDISVSCPPASTVEVTVPIWNPSSLETLEKGSPIVLRCTVLDPTGFRPLAADIVIVPQQVDQEVEAVIPVGPDAPDAMQE